MLTGILSLMVIRGISACKSWSMHIVATQLLNVDALGTNGVVRSGGDSQFMRVIYSDGECLFWALLVAMPSRLCGDFSNFGSGVRNHLLRLFIRYVR